MLLISVAFSENTRNTLLGGMMVTLGYMIRKGVEPFSAESAGENDMEGKRWAVYHITIPKGWKEANRRPSGGYPHHEPTQDIQFQFYGDERIPFDPQWYEKVATVKLNEGYDASLIWRLTNNVDESWSRDFVLPNTFEWGEMQRERPLHISKRGGELGLRSSMVGDVFHDLDNDEMWIVAPTGYEKVHNPESKQEAESFSSEKRERIRYDYFVNRNERGQFMAEYNVGGQWGQPLKMVVGEDSSGITIDFEGFSVQGAEKGGGVIHIENDDGDPIVRIWSDINREDSTHRIDLQGARDENRKE